ncbi:MAG: hypothetical protein HYU66_16345 [Armatimonadetes bacterium]|nr:hypothetical protein [Armatimonadota bacterium]
MPRTPRDTAIAALTGQPPEGLVPTFELEFQLTEEFFGCQHYRGERFAGLSAAERDRQLDALAEEYIRIYDALDYCVLMETRAPDDEARLELIRKIRALAGDRYLFVCHGDATFAIPNGSGMADFAVAMVERPDELRASADRMVDAALERGRRLVGEGMDGFALCSDYCFNTGPFLRPEQFREFVTPYLARLVQGYRELGAYVIKHTDGNIMPILDDLLMGEPHALHSLDPQGNDEMDIAKIKARVGDRVCLIGGVNCGLLQTGTDEECRDNILYTLRCGMPGGRYILSTSNVAFKGMPPYRYQMLLDLRREFGDYDHPKW